MNMKKTMIFAVAAVAAAAALAAPQRAQGSRNARGAKAPVAVAEDEVAPGKEAKVVLEQFPKTGRAATLSAPSINGGSVIGQCFTKPRKWIVLEAKYRTDAKWTDQLVFTWHVLLETKSATEKDKNDREKLPPYSYFSQTVSYVNIPRGSHAASVCLPPSYLERYGEPKAIGLVVTNPNGEVLAGDCESEIKGIDSHPKSIDKAFWNNSSVMDAKQNGEPMIERRQGLLDRSKTVWALVNPNDYEMVMQ